jgi:hypothetical protein
MRDQRAKALWTKRASKKRKPAKSEFPSSAGFLILTLSLDGGHHVERTSKVV